MRQIALLNKGVDKVMAKKAIDRLAQDYKDTGVDFQYDIEDIDIGDVRFVKYNPRVYANSLGLDFPIVSRIAKDIRKRHGDKYDLVTIFIAPEDWAKGDGGVWGWNMGEFFSGYQIQQVRISGDLWTYNVLAQEIMHSFDQFIQLELRINIANLFGVKNFDNDIVHHYQYSYLDFYRKLSLLLNRTFEIRKIRYTLKETQFSLIELLKMIVQELRIQLINAKRSVIKIASIYK